MTGKIVDFGKERFSGRGDERVMQYRTALSNALNRALFTPYLGADYVRKDAVLGQITATCTHMETVVAMAASWPYSTEGRKFAEMTVENRTAPKPFSDAQMEEALATRPAGLDAEQMSTVNTVR